MSQHEKMNYVEFPAKDIPATKAFFEAALGWSFVDYGSEYTAFSNQGLDGGFFSAEVSGSQASGGALIVFFSEQLEVTKAKVEAAGGCITKDTFEFPGGKRFHFTEPSGNEFAVWANL